MLYIRMLPQRKSKVKSKANWTLFVYLSPYEVSDRWQPGLGCPITPFFWLNPTI